MVYKKYIKRGNKIHGPYYYESYRDSEGRIKKRYFGKKGKKKTASNKFLIVGGILFILIIGMFFIFLLNLRIMGLVTLQIEDTYQPGEAITGIVKLNLKYGELVPANTNLIIDNAGQQTEYLLSELISESATDGNFYIENKDISGTGQGFGVMGEKITYPSVSFALKITESEKETGKDEEKKSETINETAKEQITETPPAPAEETITEPTQETGKKETKDTIKQDSKKVSEKLITDNNIPEPLPESTPEPSQITGGVISENLVEGTASKDAPYIYNLEEGQTAEIVSSSQDVDIKIKDNIATVTTDYSEINSGFGEEYFGDDTTELKIDLSKLNLIAKQGELSIKLIYNEQELVSASKEISVEEEITENETIVEENITIVNETIINATAENITINTTQYSAVLGKPVKWKKEISADILQDNITVALPVQATNITVYKIISGEEREEIKEANETQATEEIIEEPIINEIEQGVEQQTIEPNITDNSSNIVDEPQSETTEQKIPITAQVVSGKISAKIELDKDEKSVIAGFFRSLFKRITGRAIDVVEEQEIKQVIIDENATEFEIDYETPAPVSFESPLVDTQGGYENLQAGDSGEPQTIRGKNIIISSEVHYENVLAFTELPREVSNISDIKFYHITNKTLDIINSTDNSTITITSDTLTKVPVNFTSYDTNNNSLIDYIEWVVPGLSNESYQLIILLNRTVNIALHDCVSDYPIKYAVENGFPAPENINISVGITGDSDVFRMPILEFNKMLAKDDKYRIIQIHRLCSETIGMFVKKDSDLNVNELGGKTIAVQKYNTIDESILKDVLENKYNLNISNIRFTVEEPFSALNLTYVDAVLIGDTPYDYMNAQEQFKLILQVSEDFRDLYGKYPAKDAWVMKKEIDNETAEEIITLIRDAYNFAYDNKKDMAQKYYLETGIDYSKFFDFADLKRADYVDRIDSTSQDALQDVIDTAKKYEEINESVQIKEISRDVEKGGLFGLG